LRHLTHWGIVSRIKRKLKKKLCIFLFPEHTTSLTINDDQELITNILGNGADLLIGIEQSQNITEFAVLFMSKAEETLKRVFVEGYNKGVPVAPIIGRTIQLLSLLPSY
jgi:hypothetical protein